MCQSSTSRSVGTGRGTSTACTTWDWCAARLTVRHVDTVERAELVPVPLHVVIPLKFRANPSGSSWWTATNQERKDERMDRLGRVTATPQAREFGKTTIFAKMITVLTRYRPIVFELI